MAGFTEAQLETLEAAIAQGATRVKYADKEVDYASLDDMLKIRDLMRRELGLIKPAAGRVYVTTKKGLKGSGFGTFSRGFNDGQLD